MNEIRNRKFKFLGSGWLIIGVLGFTYLTVNFISLAQGNTPSQTEVSDGYWVFFWGSLVIGVIGVVCGLAILLRYRQAGPLVAISSVLLLFPALAIVVPLLVVVPSLWLTFTQDGKGAFRRYVAMESG